MGRDSALFRHLSQVDFEEIRLKELTEASVAESLRLPTTGQDATADIELKTFEAACQILSATKEPIKVSDSKSTLKPEWPKEESRQKAAPAKAKAESKGKEKVTFSEPPQQTEDEESASRSERTDTEKTEDERSVNEDEHSAQSPNDAGPNTNPEITEGGEEDDEEDGEEAGDEGSDKDKEEAEEAEADRVTLKLLKIAKERAESIEELYLEWQEHRFGTPYREILPGHTDLE
ncbi:protein bfr2-like [Impatiens glandulifera]|uniref:protein bfr2-like n=1 Tax=Impatiens glandulifera TaxID=253017 RepID=UPI001FB1571F|nr:protein bfr2-like [Impatiens glandulifera]